MLVYDAMMFGLPCNDPTAKSSKMPLTVHYNNKKHNSYAYIFNDKRD